MHFYSIHVIVEFNLSGSEIICRQIYMLLRFTEVVLGGALYPRGSGGSSWDDQLIQSYPLEQCIIPAL